MANNSASLKRTKHINIKHHFIREAVQTAWNDYFIILSNNGYGADIFTKQLRVQFEALRIKLETIT